MRIFLLFFLIILPCFALQAQDIIVLKKDESEIKCRIQTLNDTLILYRLWQSPDTAIYRIRRVDALSYFIDPNHSGEVESTSGKSDRNLLGKYRTGQTVSGYVVKINGDTVWGQLNPGNVARNQLEIIFDSPTGVRSTLGINDLMGYGYNGLTYRKINLGFRGEVTNGRRSTGVLFLHAEVDGEAQLYRFYTLKFKRGMISQGAEPPFYLGKLKSHYVVVHPNGKIMSTRGRTAKGVVNRVFTDYPELLQQVNKKSPKKNDLPELVRSYNNRTTN
jgi:hypothetical protein